MLVWHYYGILPCTIGAIQQLTFMAIWLLAYCSATVLHVMDIGQSALSALSRGRQTALDSQCLIHAAYRRKAATA